MITQTIHYYILIDLKNKLKFFVLPRRRYKKFVTVVVVLRTGKRK
jgi:hypothetical protein